MEILLHPCNSFSLFHSLLPLCSSTVVFNATQTNCFPLAPKWALSNPASYNFYASGYPKKLSFYSNFRIRRNTRLAFCSAHDVFDEISSTQLPDKPQGESSSDVEELELLGKPSPVPACNGSVTEVESESIKRDKDDALKPFLRFFKPRDSLEQEKKEGGVAQVSEQTKEKEIDKISVEYYEPKPGDFVVGVVVSGNENKLDVNIGADLLATMLTKEVLPLYDKEMEYLLCDRERDIDEFMVRGKMGIVKNDDALSGGLVAGRPIVDTGTVLFAEVLGRTLSGRPLLSTRRLFRRVAWHRVRQIKQLNEPFEVRITEWNTGGLLTRIEGLRAFLPKTELVNRVYNFTELKEYVGHRLHVRINRIDEANNDLILSEREAWEVLHLQEGTLLEGTVKKIFPYGAQIRIGETNRSGLLHISNISRGQISSVRDLLTIDEKVKALVVKSNFPGNISLSIADLESEPGLFLSNKEKVFSEAEQMARLYTRKLPAVSGTRKLEPLPSALPFEDEANSYANWRWFKFERDNGSN